MYHTEVGTLVVSHDSVVLDFTSCGETTDCGSPESLCEEVWNRTLRLYSVVTGRRNSKYPTL